ncbi:MAG: DUF11 domain-containing protein, partial [Caldilineae bacterium]
LLAGALFLFLLLGAIPVRALPPGFQEYFVLGNEYHIYRMLRSTGVNIPPLDASQRYMASIVDITITADRQVVYYDHWEDGYEADPLNPAQSSTLVFGDGDPANGNAADYTGRAGDMLRAGDSLSLSSRYPLTATAALTGYVPINPRQPADIRFDGGDRLVATAGPIGLVHNLWPVDMSQSPPDQTWMGDSWEIYSTQALQNALSYRIPVGEDMAGSNPQFTHVDLQIQALQDNTTVQVSNGVRSVVFTLNRGQTYSSQGYIDNIPLTATTRISITTGTTLQSDRPVQAGLIAYQYVPSTGFQDRYYNLIPDIVWGKDYLMPLADNAADAEIYMYNPNPFTITIHTADSAGSGQFALGPAATTDYTTATGGGIPTLSAVRLNSNAVFWAVAAADANSVLYDWGNTFLPQIFLTDEYYASWAPGNVLLPPRQAACNWDGNTPGTVLCRNGSPLWVAATQDGTTIHVDYDNDGTADETFTLNALQVRMLRDSTDFDQSGAHIWTEGEEKIALIWGEDPAEAGTSVPNLDVGHLILPLTQRWLTPALSFAKTARPETLPLDGGTVTFRLTAAAADFATLDNLILTDTLPFSWTYLAGSTLLTTTGGFTATPEPAITPGNGGQTLTWNLNTTLSPSQTLALRFQAAVTTGGGIGSRRFDDFESGGYGGGSTGWAGDWLDSQGDGPAAGDIQLLTDTGVTPYSGGFQIRIADDVYAIERAVDLSRFSRPVLRFKRYLRSLDGGEVFGVEAFDGATYTPILTWTTPISQDMWVQEEVDLTPFRSAAARIRFRGLSGAGPIDYLYLDDVEIYDRLAVNTNRARARALYRGYETIATDRENVYISPLKLTKSVSANAAPLGATLVFTLTYQNTGASPTPNALLRDALPPGLNFAGASAGGRYLTATNAVSWSLGSIPAGGSGQVVLTTTLESTQPPDDGDVLDNRAVLSADGASINSNRVAVTVQAPNLQVSKSAPPYAYPGDAITYTIRYANTGSLTATHTLITDTLPPQMAYLSGSCNGCLPLDGGTRLQWSPGDIAPGASGVLTFAARITGSIAPGTILHNAAQFKHDFLAVARSTGLAPTVISPVTLRKTADAVRAAPGQILTFTLTFTNASNTLTQTALLLEDPIPAHSTYVGGSATALPGVLTPTFSTDGGATFQSTEPPDPAAVTHLRWTEASLAPLASQSARFRVRASRALTLPAGTTLHNQAVLTTAQIHGLNSNRVDVPLVVPTTTLTLTKRGGDADGPPLYEGDTVRYTLALTNTGNYTALDVAVTDDLHPALTLAAAAADAGSIAQSGRRITWTVAALPPAARATLLLTTTVQTGTVGQFITNTATVTARNVPN